MNTDFRRVWVFALCFFSLLMTACLDHQFESQEKDPGSTSNNGIPEDFDYSTISTHQLTVKVKDEYEGKYYYKVEVFKSNPIENISAEFICGGKTNMNVSFTYEIVIPKTQKSIFVRLEDPKGFKFVTEVEVTEGDWLLDYNVPDPEVKSLTRSNFSQNDPIDDSSFQAGLKDATEVTAGQVNLKVGGVYKITDKNFDEQLTLPAGRFVLYIGEGCTLNVKKNVELTDGAEIYVLKGGGITLNSAEFKVGRGSKILNAGTLKLKGVYMEGANNVLYNHPGGKIDLTKLSLNGSEVFNHCLLSASEMIFKGTGSNFYMSKNSSLEASNISFEGGLSDCGIYMGARAFLHVNSFNKMENSYLSIFGETGTLSFSDYPLIQIEGAMKCTNVLVYRSILLDTKGRKDGVSLIGMGPQMVEGSLPTEMKGGCYAVENNPGDKDFTEDSKDPVYEPEYTETNAYIYMFEDNWPGIGDYDMNDVVVNISVLNHTAGNNSTKAVIAGEVIAVGAKKALYIFAQIDGTDKVVNLLGNQEIHAFMGKSVTETINTFRQDCDPKSFFLEIDVAGLKGIVNANNLNVFIVSGDPGASKRNEIHIAGFYGTKQAATSSNSTKDYRNKSAGDDYGLMWGLMIPKGNYSSYPIEGCRIMDAYPGFLDWAKSGGKSAIDWYSAGIEDFVFHKK